MIGLQPENDLAVLQAKTIPDDLAPATLRSTRDLAVGDRSVGKVQSEAPCGGVVLRPDLNERSLPQLVVTAPLGIDEMEPPVLGDAGLLDQHGVLGTVLWWYLASLFVFISLYSEAPRMRVWYNSSLESRNYIVPGLIAASGSPR